MRQLPPASARDVVEPHDLPIGAGLQQCMYIFRDLDEVVELEPLLKQLTAQPAVDLTASEQTRERLPMIAGGLTVALARAFRVLDPERHNPGSADWDKATELFDLLIRAPAARTGRGPVNRWFQREGSSAVTHARSAAARSRR